MQPSRLSSPRSRFTGIKNGGATHSGREQLCAKKNFDVPFCKRMGHENGMDRWIDRLTDRQKDMVIPVCPKFCLVRV